MILTELTLEPQDNKRLSNLCGELEKNLNIIQNHLSIKISHRGYQFSLSGEESAVQIAVTALKTLYEKTLDGSILCPQEIHMSMQGLPEAEAVGSNTNNTIDNNMGESVPALAITTIKAGLVMAKGAHQLNYMHNMMTHDVNFGIGPAGTGKTFLAVLCAVEALDKENVNRIILVRPAVEAGESLGFLPGDFSQKVEPYLRPLYDALHDLMGPEWVQKHMERGQIEVAPLAYMRGRTLNDAFIILDEAQNTTRAQMKMFLTRLGFGSTAVITGDITQVDLPGRKQSGLMHAIEVLKDVEGIGFTQFEARDAVRHRLVQRIIKAYDLHK